MIGRSKWLTTGGVMLLLATAGCDKLRSRDDLNKGVVAYKNQKYNVAIDHFKEAVELDPTSKNARLYLAISYMIQWVPGAASPDNEKNHDMAVKTFDQILKDDPTNTLALAYMANMAYQQAATGTDEQKKTAFEDAKRWNEKRVEVNPKESEGYYYLGVIDWSEVFPAYRDTRSAQKLKPDDPGFIKDAKIRDDFKTKYATLIQEGIDNLQKCLQYAPKNEDAMQYMNLLLREKAITEDTPDAAKADIAQAESLSDKALEIRKFKATQPQKTTQQS